MFAQCVSKAYVCIMHAWLALWAVCSFVRVVQCVEGHVYVACAPKNARACEYAYVCMYSCMSVSARVSASEPTPI